MYCKWRRCTVRWGGDGGDGSVERSGASFTQSCAGKVRATHTHHISRPAGLAPRAACLPALPPLRYSSSTFPPTLQVPVTLYRDYSSQCHKSSLDSCPVPVASLTLPGLRDGPRASELSLLQSYSFEVPYELH